MIKQRGSATDPLWFKDAVIYELHVRAFADSNNDGIGDLRGLISKLDYIQDLGVTCLWLLPFFPSPLRDDGYDIADYLNIHPDYGTMDDFTALVAAAHERGLQVMIELVMNHTSDSHVWFQRAREAAAGSPERDFYVWSDSDQKYKDARIIFTDTEHSNWTWDPVAKAYYWHRFFSHQPDLNFENPLVVAEMLSVMRYWLDLGVDGLRLDAIPYLIERDGTNCENLPETHVLIKRVREEMDARYENRVILAEANQWPSDVRPYFGDGDECHMAFHFPLMPRIFMALRLEDGHPIREIMGQTPAIPASCQWGLFLRNHDELTLEMVSEQERDYMYLAYSADPRMRINIGIRRRLAPLMENNRRRIELLNSLLFSFPGTPILYYGDEIGMGDNIYLGDRNGVRTPMQWNADRNAGFSRATPAKLYSPVVMDPVYGYEAVNVEAEQSDPSSLLHWMRNMIALRKLFRVFGRGTLEFLESGNRKVLAYLRRYDGEQVLCVANLSRFAQPVELDLSAFVGWRPVEMAGYVEFPVIGKRPYTLTPGPYAFMWFELQQRERVVEVEAGEQALDASQGWPGVFGEASRERLETVVLPRFLPLQRWFAGKARAIRATTVADWVAFDGGRAAVMFVAVQYDQGEPDTYVLPIAMDFNAEREVPASALLCGVTSASGQGILFDATFDDATRTALLMFVEHGQSLRTEHGEIRGVPSGAFAELRGAAGGPLPTLRTASEQSNTSLLYGDRLILKLFRRQQCGLNPDCEVGRHLTELHFPHVPAFAGSIDYVRTDQEPASVGLLQALVPNQGDGWSTALEELGRYYEACSPREFPGAEETLAAVDLLGLADAPVGAFAREHVGIYLDAAATLGRRTGAMHRALALPSDDPAFAPESLTQADLQTLAGQLRAHAALAFGALRAGLPSLAELDPVVESVALALSRRQQVLGSFQNLGARDIGGLRTRIHGDYHLGQIVWVRNDAVILDFEGEPGRPLEERRRKHSPLKDVAGMLRSFSYAAWASLLDATKRGPEAFERLEPWARLWERSVSVAFLRAYRETVMGSTILPPGPGGASMLLNAYLLDRALHEVEYELNNRPAWLRIPLRCILALQS